MKNTRLTRAELRADLWRIAFALPIVTVPAYALRGEFRQENDLSRMWRLIHRQSSKGRDVHARARYEQALFTLAARDRFFARSLSVSERA